MILLNIKQADFLSASVGWANKKTEQWRIWPQKRQGVMAEIMGIDLGNDNDATGSSKICGQFMAIKFGQKGKE